MEQGLWIDGAMRLPIITKEGTGYRYEWPIFESEAERVSNFYKVNPHLYNPTNFYWPELDRLQNLNAEPHQINACLAAIDRLKQSGMLLKRH